MNNKKKSLFICITVLSVFVIFAVLILFFSKQPPVETGGIKIGTNKSEKRSVGHHLITNSYKEIYRYVTLTRDKPYNQEFNVYLKEYDFSEQTAVIISYYKKSKYGTPIERTVKKHENISGSGKIGHTLWEVKEDGVILLMLAGSE